MDEQQTDYVAMAARYREHLLQEDKLSHAKRHNTNVYLDFLCMTTEPASFLGVPYVKKTVLSTLEQIQQTVDTMVASGIQGIVVRLIGYGKGGLENHVYNRYSLDRRVGTDAQLKTLAKTLAEHNGQLVLDADFMFSYSQKNGFGPTSDAAQYLNRMVVRSERYDIVTRKYYGNLARYFVSPLRYEEYASRFAKDVKDLLGDNGSIGLSYGTAGLYLGGDYSPKRSVDRIESAAYLTAAVKESSKTAGEMVFDNGNAYVIPCADHILNLPMTSSQTDMETKSIPFYQMVVHGFLPYAGTPYNLTGNVEKAHLQSISYGALPYYTLITADDDVLSNTAYESMWYSLSQNGRLRTLMEQCLLSQKYRDATRGVQMIAFEEVDSSVICTKFSNGVHIYVNYGTHQTTVDGVTVGANEFALVHTNKDKGGRE